MVAVYIMECAMRCVKKCIVHCDTSMIASKAVFTNIMEALILNNP